MPFLSPVLPVLVTLVLGAIGAALAAALQMPAPYLVGPAALATLACLCGIRIAVPPSLRNAAFLAVGLSMGSTITPDVLAATAQWPLSFVALFAMSAILLLTASGFLRRVFGYDRLTALLAACPGHLSYVLSLAAGTRSDLAAVSVIQSVRLLALTLLVPIVVELYGLTPPANLAAPLSAGPLALLAMALPALALGLALQRLRVPAALLVGGMLVSSLAHLTGLVEGVIPFWLQVPVYVILGCLIGTRFSGVTGRDLRRSTLAGLSATAVVCAISGAVAAIVSIGLDIPLAAAFIAFAPGGLETMSAMAVILQADPAYVGTHHILRLVFLSFVMPMLLSDRFPSLFISKK